MGAPIKLRDDYDSLALRCTRLQQILCVAG